jgi:hypothetical protein
MKPSMRVKLHDSKNVKQLLMKKHIGRSFDVLGKAKKAIPRETLSKSDILNQSQQAKKGGAH